MKTTARGPFEVDMKPLAPDEGTGDSPIGRTSIDKRYRGDLEAIGKGQMLAVRSQVEGSAGYVAMEQVSGALHGRRGTFVLQHSGLMTRGEPELTVSVVPDSGTGELEGLTGSMEILIDEDGGHSYVLQHTLLELP